MANTIRLSKILKEFNIGIFTVVEFLKKKGIAVESNPNERISEAAYGLVAKEFGREQDLKEASKKISIKPISITSVSVSDIAVEEEIEEEREIIIKTNTVEPLIVAPEERYAGPKVVGKLSAEELLGKSKKPQSATVEENKKPESQVKVKVEDQAKSEPQVKSEVPTKPEVPMKPEVKSESKSEHKSEVKLESKPERKLESRPEQKLADKSAQKPATQKPEAAKPAQVEAPKKPEDEVITAKQRVSELIGPKIIEKIELPDQHGKSGRKRKKRRHKRDRPHETPKVVEPKEVMRVSPAAVAAAAVAAKAAAAKATPPPAAPEKTEPEKVEPEFIKTKVEQLSGPNVVGKIDLAQFKKPDHKSGSGNGRKKRQRIRKDGSKVNVPAVAHPARDAKKPTPPNSNNNNNKDKDKRGNKPTKEPVKPVRQQVDDDAVQRQVKDTLARLTSPKGKTKSSKYRREKRDAVSQRFHEEQEQRQKESSILKVTEFVTVNELATMMNIPVIKVIEACMNLGLMVSINQRLDAEALVVVAEEFGFKVEFITADLQDSIEQEADVPEDLRPRPPIITVMGHVDHGKTSLLDYIRKANVIAGEAGGITQHIGAYSVELQDGQHITFLDTPGHEAFTAMRARGAKITDVAIIIVAADDAVMPQTVEAINHAVAAGVPMIFAVNKIDKPGANPQKIYEQLSQMNYLVEEWGGKFQNQEISAKQGINVDKLLEKVLLEADMLDLKANPDKRAVGTVIESSLDKGRGYVTTLLVQNGTLKIGDVILSGTYTGRVKAMFNERQQRIQKAGPATPVLVLGLNGAPAAGETFNVMDEKEAREIAGKREQLLRIQDLKTKKHITLEEIGRRIAIGSFKELNIVLKADVDGSMEALSDSLIKLTNEEVQVNIIHKAVGAVSESDVLLAAASNAIIVGFQVRPSASARKMAEREEIEIRLYSIIYDAINEVRDGIEGMLAPEVKEEITSTVEVLEVFKINKVGSVAGCMVREGKIVRHANVRIIRDGIVVYTGKLGSLKRFKDDAKEVNSGYECGLNIENFNDIKQGDMIESYEQVEVKRKL
ncbi:MAG: translation initiation factor IF-2 [Prevotellaceae bacterium]|jgi:translation initiation factor IF-2|nr:translation initiation factor IF-2 [Prevotellaceae bacterium]